MAEYGTKRRPRRRGRGLLITLIVLLIIVGVVLFAGRPVRPLLRRADHQRQGRRAGQQPEGDEREAGRHDRGLPVPDPGRGREVRRDQDRAGQLLRAGRPERHQEDQAAAARHPGPERPGLAAARCASGGNIVAGTVTGTGTIDYKQVAALVEPARPHADRPERQADRRGHGAGARPELQGHRHGQAERRRRRWSRCGSPTSTPPTCPTSRASRRSSPPRRRELAIDVTGADAAAEAQGAAGPAAGRRPAVHRRGQQRHPQLERSVTAGLVPGSWSALLPVREPLVGSAL